MRCGPDAVAAGCGRFRFATNHAERLPAHDSMRTSAETRTRRNRLGGSMILRRNVGGSVRRVPKTTANPTASQRRGGFQSCCRRPRGCVAIRRQLQGIAPYRLELNPHVGNVVQSSTGGLFRGIVGEVPRFSTATRRGADRIRARDPAHGSSPSNMYSTEPSNPEKTRVLPELMPLGSSVSLSRR